MLSMPARLLSIVHQRDAGPGVFASVDAELEEWRPRKAPPPSLAGFDAVMVFGGAMNAHEEARHPWLRPEKELLREVLDRRLPVLGVCLGSQLLSEVAGAEPRRADRPEIGWCEIALTPEAVDDPLLGGLPERFEGFGWHSYESPLPPGAVPLARSPVCLQAYRLDGAPAWGLQFHAEVTEETVGRWLDDSRSDEDAVRVGLDPEALRAETRAKIGTWMDTGRAIARRFVAAATRA
jgi:GMP synthase (glutamine-hydrolysing)